MKSLHRLSQLAARSLAVLTAASLLAVTHLQAQSVPEFIDYQGRVVDGNGAPLAAATPGNFEMEFRIWDATTGGAVVWAEKQLVTVNNGQFSVRLGEGQGIIVGGGGREGLVSDLKSAFDGSSRHLGVSVSIPGQAPGEITPRLTFLSAPFALKAASASSVVQAAGTTSNLTVGSISYTSQSISSSLAVDGNSRTVLVDSAATPVTATLPVSGAQKEILFAKTDSTTNQVVVSPPAGGTINGSTASIRLKVKGESVTLQNVGGTAWWIVNENRDKTPVGTIIAYSSSNVPAGYLACDGSQPARATYPDLVAVLGTNWGVPGNVNNFRVPDLRGSFLRGRDGGRGLDDGRGSRTADFVGAATGDNIGSYQFDDYRSHSHGVNDPGHGHGVSVSSSVFRNNSETGAGGWQDGALKTTDRNPSANGWASGYTSVSVGIQTGYTGISIQSSGGAETRPDNYNVNYCIKY